jgi:hypothetical protein
MKQDWEKEFDNQFVAEYGKWKVDRAEVKDFIRQLRQDDIKSLIDIIEKSFKEWFSKDWKATKYQANYSDNPLEDFMKIIYSHLKE